MKKKGYIMKKDFTTFEDVLIYIKSDACGSNMIDVIIAAIKQKRIDEAKKVKSSITVGSKVGVSGRTEYWLGTVEKVMKTRCAVKNMNNGLRYAVPMNLIDVKEVA